MKPERPTGRRDRRTIRGLRFAGNEAKTTILRSLILIAIGPSIVIIVIFVVIIVITFNFRFKIVKAAVDYNINFSFILVPGGPPLNITAQNTSSTSINVTWKPIDENLQRGLMLGYRITFKKQQEASRRKRRSTHDSVLVKNKFTRILEGLEKFTNYCVKIVGFNSKGDGNVSNWLCVSTDEDGKRLY